MIKSDAKLSKTIKILEKIMEMYRISFFFIFPIYKMFEISEEVYAKN